MLDPFLFDLFSFVFSVISVLKMQRVFHWGANQGTSLLQTNDCGQGVLLWPRHTDQLQPEPGGPVEGKDSILCCPASLSECGHPNNNRCYTWRLVAMQVLCWLLFWKGRLCRNYNVWNFQIFLILWLLYFFFSCRCVFFVKWEDFYSECWEEYRQTSSRTWCWFYCSSDYRIQISAQHL